MSPAALQAYLHEHIPLAQAMAVEVRAASPAAIELIAPLAPNVNHRGTAFGGSIVTLATLAGWSLLRVRLDSATPLPHLVIQRSRMDYLRPIDGAFCARVAYPLEADWPTFLARLAERGRARLTLEVEVWCGDTLAARMEGVFVALTV